MTNRAELVANFRASITTAATLRRILGDCIAVEAARLAAADFAEQIDDLDNGRDTPQALLAAIFAGAR